MQLKDWLPIMVPLVLGAIGTVLWSIGLTRNYLTREFKIKCSRGATRQTGNILQSMQFAYELECTRNREITIKDLYLKIPNNVLGNTSNSPNWWERIHRRTGAFYVKTGIPLKFVSHYRGEFTISDAHFLRMIAGGHVRNMRLVADTIEYGRVKSNSIPRFLMTYYEVD